jgi:hypothetical protein
MRGCPFIDRMHDFCIASFMERDVGRKLDAMLEHALRESTGCHIAMRWRRTVHLQTTSTMLHVGIHDVATRFKRR